MSYLAIPFFYFYRRNMNILISYLKKHRWIVVMALFLAAMNIGFSLLDPWITGRIVDRVIEKRGTLHYDEYLRQVLTLVGAAIGVAMVSRIAKNFQDYFTNIITQKVGAAAKPSVFYKKSG
jgi:ATP-binding cassette subfamily B protein